MKAQLVRRRIIRPTRAWRCSGHASTVAPILVSFVTLIVTVPLANAAPSFAFASTATAALPIGALPPSAPINQTVRSQLLPQLDHFFDQLTAEKTKLAIDGTLVFNGRDKFLPGKIAVGLSHVLVNTPPSDARFGRYLRSYREIADMTIGMDNETWGAYYYLLALHRLKTAGLLERAISPETLAALKQKLDWRLFVTQPDFNLINLPTNYYGVAFSVARLRHLLGWEDDTGSQKLLDKLLTHYRTHSGAFGFSDETEGEGRFDRYSVLLIAEICQRFIETGLPISAELKGLLRRAATVALNLANTNGDGFSFGRSIGPYADTAMLEILSTAAFLDVLTPDEKQYAYAYSSRITTKYVRFWFDPKLHSVDMWGKGRRTDAYRGKHRILGENLSLLHQLISTNQMWNRAGFTDQMPRADLQQWLDKTQPAFSLTRFAQGEYDRALAIIRDRQHLFSLLMVNGGQGQYANSPYYPLPFSTLLIAGVADGGPAHAQLLPKFTVADGTQLLPTTYIQNIRTEKSGGAQLVHYSQDGLARLGKNRPEKDVRLRLETTYRFSSGSITRTDRYVPTMPIEIDSIVLDFASFSEEPTLKQGTVRFGKGIVTRFSVTGLPDCSTKQTNGRDDFKSPSGPMHTLVTCRAGRATLSEPFTISWTLHYQ